MGSFDQLVTFLYVADLDRAATFYSEVLGLDLALDQGQCRIYRVTPTAFVGICHGPERAGESDGVMVTLVTDDVDEAFARAAASGAAVDRSPGYNRRFDIYQAIVRDPDGNRIEIQQFRDPAWERPDPR